VVTLTPPSSTATSGRR